MVEEDDEAAVSGVATAVDDEATRSQRTQEDDEGSGEELVATGIDVVSVVASALFAFLMPACFFAYLVSNRVRFMTTGSMTETGTVKKLAR